MVDIFFFFKTLLLTFIVVLLLQIQVQKKTVETHIHDYMGGSIAAGFLGNVAHGAALFMKDATFKMTQKMKQQIGIKREGESREIKSSRFKWGWDKAKDSEIDNAKEAKGTAIDRVSSDEPNGGHD